MQAASFHSSDHLNAATITATMGNKQDGDDNRNAEDQDIPQQTLTPMPEPSKYSPFSSAPPRHTWEGTPASAFHVRGPVYKHTGRKQPSLDSFYSLISFDFVKTSAGCVNHVARFMGLEQVRRARSYPGFPPLFIVNTQLPDGEPSMFSSVEGGPSRSAVFVFALKASTVDLLEKHTQEKEQGEGKGGRERGKEALPPALLLLQDYFRRAPCDAEVRGRFKVIASCVNLDELSLPSFISNYNGKPVLITRSGRLFQGYSSSSSSSSSSPSFSSSSPTALSSFSSSSVSSAPSLATPSDLLYLEIDINVHRFAFLAQKGLKYLKTKFPAMVLDMAFLIEGRRDDELPEQVLGAARLNFMEYEKAVEGVFDGLGKQEREG